MQTDGQRPAIKRKSPIFSDGQVTGSFLPIILACVLKIQRAFSKKSFQFRNLLSRFRFHGCYAVSSL